MRRVTFAKVESLQNDFVVVSATGNLRWWTPERAAAICDRRTGVGADGLILLSAETSQGIRFRLFNADGSRAEWSGNGVRGAAALLAAGDPRRREWRFLTGAGTIRVTIRHLGAQRVEAAFVHPIPQVSAAAVPRVSSPRGVDGPYAVQAGNPHWVFLVRDFGFQWEELGAQCQRLPEARPTGGINVEFVCVHSRRVIELRIFERGVGPTPASGSGALSAYAACRHYGLVDRTIRVLSPGGEQQAAWDSAGNEVRLSAPAQIVCTGIWFRPVIRRD